MTDPLDMIWTSFDTPECLFTADEVGRWPSGFLQRLLEVGLLQEASAADHVVCPECAEPHVEEVIVSPSAEGGTRFVIPCPEALRVEIPAESLRRWTISLDGVARLVAVALGCPSGCSLLVPARLWRLGRTKWQGASRDLVLAHGLLWPDARQITEHIDRHGRTIVFVAHRPPSEQTWPHFVPPVVPLSSVARLTQDGLALDLADTAAQVADSDARNQTMKPVPLTPTEQKKLFRREAGSALKSFVKDDEILNAYRLHGSVRKAAAALAISKDKVHRTLQNHGGAEAVRAKSDSQSVRRTVASRGRDRRKNYFKAPEPTE